MKTTRIGIIICDRYRNCGGGKCFRAMKNREGAFSIYSEDTELELVGYSSCGGCPGGNIEYVPGEMKKNGAQVIHLATGFLVGYPPCPYIDHFMRYIQEQYGLKVVAGTHPVPEKYFLIHEKLGTWEAEEWKPLLEAGLPGREMRKAYD